MTPETARAFRRLGVTEGADAATIRRAWRNLVRKHHPDTFQGDRSAVNRHLAEINAAFDLVLTHADRPKHRPRRERTKPAPETVREDGTRSAGTARARSARKDRPKVEPMPRPGRRTRLTVAETRFRDALKVVSGPAQPALLGFA